MEIKKSIYFSILFAIMTAFLHGLTWPVAEYPKVAVTYGDYSLGEVYPFHSGVDIQCNAGIKAIALSNGTVLAKWQDERLLWNFSFQTDDQKMWIYEHLTSDIELGYFTEGSEIGTIAHYPWAYGFDDHLHLVFNEPTTWNKAKPIDNPLLYLPYSDPGNKSPFVWFPEIFIYNRAAVKNVYNKLWWLYPTYAGQPTPKIYDYVDIIAKAQDDMNGTLANGNKVYTGVFEPGFWITDMADNGVLGPSSMDIFSGPLPDAGQFDAFFSKENPSSNWHDFYYIVTNVEGDATKCWATKARSGGTSENDPRARINYEAIFPDKEYKIWLINRDAGGHLSQDVAYVSVDNFRPYVHLVQIGQEEKVVKYQAHWPEMPVSDYDLGALIVDVDDYCKVGKLLTFLIEFSEDMKTDVLPTIQVQFPDGTIKTVPSGEWIGSNVYRAVTGDDFISSDTSGRATLWISGAYDLANNQNDGNPRTIAYRDAGGDWRQAEAPPDDNYKFWIEAPPQVISTDPADSAQGVDIFKKVKLVFNKPMDTVSVREALTVERLYPYRECLLLRAEWDTEMEILEVLVHDPLVPDSGFDFYNDYKVIISGEIARDTAGVFLDGDKNGQPGGNYVFTFTTRKPNVKFAMDPNHIPHEVSYDPHSPPPNQYFTDYSSAILTNKEQRDLTVNFTATGGELLLDSLIIPRMSTISDTVLKIVTASDYHVEISAKIIIEGKEVFNDTKVVDVTVINKHSQANCDPPDHDIPDDNWQVNDPQYPSPWYVGTDCEVGILISGYCAGVGHLLGRFKIPTAIVNLEGRVLGTLNRTLDSLKVLIIPSGALYGKENNAQFKERIRNFVENGGSVICMTQQYGYEWGALPGSPTGYGWRQDQSCCYGAGYFSDWDVILSGQNSVIINSHIDGFFTDAPNNAKVIMKRRTSAMPELFYYDYGQGKVLVCGLYADWGYGQSQWSNEEANLIRDIVTWAVDTKRPIPEYYAGNSMSLNIPIYYYPDGDTTPANKVKVEILKPNRDSLYTTELPLSPSLRPGDSTVINLTYNAPAILGIYPVNYSLYNDTFLLQKEKLGERFAVKTDIPVGEYMLGDLAIWATSETEFIFSGDTAHYTIFLRNSTSTPFYGKIMIGIHELFGSFWKIVDSLMNIEIPPDTVITLSYSRQPLKSTSTYFGLYLPDVYHYPFTFPNAVAQCVKGVYVTPALCDIIVDTDTTNYFSGAVVRYINHFVTNFSETDTFETKVFRMADNSVVYAIKDTITYKIEGVARADSFSLQGMQPGAYKIETRAYRKGQLLKNGFAYFNIDRPKVLLSIVPDTRITGNDTVLFVFSVTPETTVCFNNKLEYWIGCMCPPHPILTGEIEIDTLVHQDTIIFPFNLPMDSLIFGLYTFKYTLNTIDTVAGSYDFWNSISFTTQLDRQSYSWRDTITMTVRVKNLGVFEESLHFEIITPSPGYVWQDGTADFFMHLNMDTLLVFKSYITEGYSAGVYGLFPTIRAGAGLIKNGLGFLLNVPNILIATDTIHYQAGDTIKVIFYNSGGVEAELRLKEIGLYDYYWNRYYQDSAYVILQPDSFFFYEIPVDTLLKGDYQVFIDARIENYAKDFTHSCGISLDGVWADLGLKTSKDVYLTDEHVKPQVRGVNGKYPFNGNINLSITPYGLYPGDTTFIPGDEYMWRINEWTSPGCTLSNGKLVLLGWDKMYDVDYWTFEPDKGRSGKGSGERELLLRILEAKKQGKGRGEEPIRYTAMAEKNGKLYMAMSTDVRRKIIGPYPDWNETYDLSEIASISHFAMDENYFYIVDPDSEYIYKVSRGSGAIERRWKVSNPGGIGIFNNNLYLIDRLSHHILKTDLDGDTVLVFGADSLIEPMDLAVDSVGRIYVADINKTKVYIFDNNGNYIGTKGDGHKFSQIAVDKKGYLYGADMDSLKVAKYDENGNLLEYYSHYPDEIMACDTLIHLAKIYSDYFDYVSGTVLTNYGRNKGYSNTEAIQIPGLKYIYSFVPTDDPGSGEIDYFFSYGYPNGHEWPNVPVDSLAYIDFEQLWHPYIYFKAVIFKPDIGESPEVEKLDISYLSRRSGSTIWEGSSPLSFLPDDSVLVELDAGVIPDSGEFILWDDLYLANGQHYPPLEHHNFYITPTLLSFALRTDREIYYSGEEIATTLITVNNADSIFTDVTLELFKRQEKIFDTLLASLGPQSACTLSLSLSDSSSFPLTGLLFRPEADTLKQYKSIDIQIPQIEFWTAYPCSVDHKPFEINTEISNWWQRDVNVVFRSACGDSEYIDTVLLYPDESRLISHKFTVTKDETLFTQVLMPKETTGVYLITFGEKLEVRIDSFVSSENSVLIPYSVANIGGFDCAFDFHLAIIDSIGTIHDSITYSNILPVGDTIIGEWGIILDYGKYQLSWIARPESSAAIISQGSVPVNIIQPNLLSIDSIVLLPECDSLGNLIFEVLIRNNSANTFYGNIGLFASFINETKEFEIGPLMDSTITFISNAILSEGHQEVMAKVLQNGTPIFEYSDSLYFEARLILDSLPEMLSFNAGDTAQLCIKTKNNGTAVGEENLKLEMAELGEIQTPISLIPGEARVDTFVFYIPEDMDERTIYGSVWLGDEEYILPIHILGYRVVVSASLNQPNFQPGDTVILNLNIANQNERNIKGFSTANYNGENITTQFYLAGYAQNIDFSNTEILKAAEPTASGIYVSKVLCLDNWDSLIVKAEGQGNFGFWVRFLEPDSVHYTFWSSETCFARTGPEQSLLLQFKVEFNDTVSYLERINLRIFTPTIFHLPQGGGTMAGGYRDTVIEIFEPVDIAQQFKFPFDPMVNLMFYGVYTETGRGLWLNTIHIFPANDTCNLITDRQVYEMGDTVFATVQSPYSGKLIWHADFYPMGTISDSLWIDTLSNQFAFALPAELASGSYSIDFDFYITGDTLQKFSASQPFDVRGYEITVIECRLDSNEYEPNDSMFIRFKLNSNSDIPVIIRLRFMQNYQPYDALCDTIDADSGFNVIDLATVVPALERGQAFLNYSFHKDSIFLTYASEGFMVYVPDTIPPVAQFIEVPENTYNPNIEHTVKIIATDETHIYNTLYYHNGITLNWLSHQVKKGDTLIYKIPSQPRGTIIGYQVVLVDSFMNRTTLPEKDYNLFWVLSPLPPSDCGTDTIDQNIEITWQSPSENLIYHAGYPYEAKTDSIALRCTPQYLPAELKLVKLFIEKTIPDTAMLDVSFYSVIDGRPGLEIYPAQQIKIGVDGANWFETQIDSVLINGEMFVIFSGEGIKFYGDGDNNVYRTLIKDSTWHKDTIFGNLLAQANFSYETESIYFRVLREDSVQFVVIGDSLVDERLIDSLVSGERRYRYLVQAHYIVPDLNGTSPILTQTYDYTPPVFGDSVVVIEYDEGYSVGCEITDGIGLAMDSLVYNGIAVGHDSIISDWYWYTIPKDKYEITNNKCQMNDQYQSPKDNVGSRFIWTDNKRPSGDGRYDRAKGILDGLIAYYFIANDSAGNFARNPDTGYFYIIPHIPEGFSGHISKDTTWATDILIKGDVWVDSGATLTINPGVNVRFIPNFDDEHAGVDTTRAEFIIRGGLALLGNDSMYVTFTSDGGQPEIGDWYGIRFENPGASIELGYTEIGYAEIGLYYGLNKPFKVQYCRIEFCDTGVNSASKFTKLTDSEFLNNRNGALINDGRLNLVKRCEFRENITALKICGDGSNKSDISGEVNNTASGLNPGEIASAAIDGLARTDEFNEDELRITNTSEEGKWQLALVFENAFTDNDTGIVFSDCAIGMVRKNEITNNLIGVYITEDAWPILGIRMSGQNKIEPRFQMIDSSYAVYNNTKNYILAEGNWWGTNSEDSIALIIWDFYDDKNLGVVDYKPFRQYEVAGGKANNGVQSNLENEIREYNFYVPAIVSGNDIRVSYTIPDYSTINRTETKVHIEIYDIIGRLCKQFEFVESCGVRNHYLGCSELTAGIYFIRFKANNFCVMKKIILVK